MVIDITPAARGGQGLAARVQMGHAQPDHSGGQGGAWVKCLCCNGHPESRREGRAAPLLREHAESVLWRHAASTLSAAPEKMPRSGDQSNERPTVPTSIARSPPQWACLEHG
jgi:hypothetical protein